MAFLDRCRQKTYADGTNLFKERTEATRLYLIVEGGIDLRFEMPFREIPSSTITSSRAGDAIGWSTIVPPHLLSALRLLPGQDRGAGDRP